MVNKIEEIKYEDYVKENSGSLYTTIPSWKAKKILLKTGDTIEVIIRKKEDKKL